jgi:ABC-type branched-subunit amino acid transport system ATPase component/ABC-type branched-subunit amino acid transport system permease subunit
MTSGLILGFITGLTYGLLAVGIVLIYKANRFINVANAQLGTVSALLLAKFVLDDGWSWWIAFPVVIGVGVGIGLLIERVIIRRMLSRKRHSVSLLLVSIGVAQLLLALTYVKGIGPSSTALFRDGYPVPIDANIDTGALLLTGDHILILVLVPSCVGALALFMKYSAWGKAIRAAASNPDAARLCGIPVSRVSATAWGIAGALSAITAVLQAPNGDAYNTAALGPGLLLRALGAAAFGGFTSIPAALAGGLIIGEAEHLTLAWRSDAGDAELAVLLTVMVILFVRGKVIASTAPPDSSASDVPVSLRVPTSVLTRPIVRYASPGLGALALVIAVLIPVLPFFNSEAHRFELVVTLVMAVCGVALTMLVGWAGQVSLGNFAILGLGAYLAAKFGAHNLSLLTLLLLAGAVGGLVSAVIGLPALRLRGLTLAITTLGFAVVAPIWLFQQSWLGSEGQSAVEVPHGGFIGTGRLDSQQSIYYAALILLVLTLFAASRLRRSMPGRLVMAVRDNETAVASFGLSPAPIKLSILAVTGAVTAMAGVLWGMSWETVSPDIVPPDASLVLLAIPVIGGLGSLSGAVAGALFLYLPAFFISPLLTPLFGDLGKQIGFQLALAGLSLVVIPLAYPAGLAGVMRDGWQRFLNRLATEVDTISHAHDDRPLVATGVKRKFGGMTVLDGVDVEVHPGEIVGLIGPNGAGKTTLMNIISGDLPPDSGSIAIFGRDVTGLPPYYRAHLGLGRNYQEASLFAGLTVTEVLQVALSRTERVGAVSSMVAAPWARASERRSKQRAREIVERFHLEPWANTQISALSTGTRRICELAAQVASAPRVVLLDEPTAGVAQRDAEAFGPLVREIRDELDCSILIIEHDMPLLMGLCDRVYALETGRVIAMGTAEEVRVDPLVVASYLGTSDSAMARSGSRADQLAAT